MVKWLVLHDVLKIQYNVLTTIKLLANRALPLNKTTTPRNRAATSPSPRAKVRPKAAKRSSRPLAEKNLPPPASSGVGHKLTLIMLEVTALVITAVSLIMVILGYSANWFSGTHFFSSLLPFAAGVLVLILAAALILIGWWRLRKWLQGRAAVLSPVLATAVALLIGWFAVHDQFTLAYGHFRTLVGGKQEASRVTLAHQVYAAYRRYDAKQLQRMVDRAEAYNPVILQAAKAFDIDPNLLQGVAATESSFMPRDSQDGGHGLFQITQVPKTIMEQAGRRLGVNTPSVLDHRHNAFIAAATLKYYLAEMHDDMFLGLLAYNIGPANGGLRFIMQQYGATDFVTIQPYLQQLPRDYPIRVLSYALAFRLWQKERKLPAYEEGNNAARIQRIGIPGLQTDF